MSAWKRWSLPFFMIAVSLALGTWWRASRELAFREPFQSLQPDRVSVISVVSPSATLRYERRGDAWRQVAPYEHPTDPAAIRMLLATATDVAPAYRVRLDQAPENSGLAKSDLVLELGAGKDVLARFRVGSDHPAGLAWIGEEQTGLAGPCPRDLRQLSMAAAGGALRDDRLFELAGADSDRIRIVTLGPQGGAVLLERGAGGWRMAEPFACRADEAAVGSFLQAAARLRHAGQVQADAGDGSVHGLATPSAQVMIRTMDPAQGAAREEAVQFGADSGAGAIFARQVGRPPVVSVDARQLAGVLLPPGAFVDPRVSEVPAEDMVALRVLDTEGRQRLHLRRDLGIWSRVPERGDPEVIQDGAVRELLRSLCEVRANAVAGDLPRDEWRIGSIEVSCTDGSQRQVTLWRLPDGGWAIREGQGPARVFPASLPMPIEPGDHPPKR
jgi:hypothetical protein